MLFRLLPVPPGVAYPVPFDRILSISLLETLLRLLLLPLPVPVKAEAGIPVPISLISLAGLARADGVGDGKFSDDEGEFKR